MISINNSLFSILIKSTDDIIRDIGVTSLSDALKSSTTLMELYLGREDERNNTNNPLFFHSHQINREQDWRNRSNIVE